jgi:hypothetical protein
MRSGLCPSRSWLSGDLMGLPPVALGMFSSQPVRLLARVGEGNPSAGRAVETPSGGHPAQEYLVREGVEPNPLRARTPQRVSNGDPHERIHGGTAGGSA